MGERSPRSGRRPVHRAAAGRVRGPLGHQPERREFSPDHGDEPPIRSRAWWSITLKSRLDSCTSRAARARAPSAWNSGRTADHEWRVVPARSPGSISKTRSRIRATSSSPMRRSSGRSLGMEVVPAIVNRPRGSAMSPSSGGCRRLTGAESRGPSSATIAPRSRSSERRRPARERIVPHHGPAGEHDEPALQPDRFAAAHVRGAHATDLPAVGQEILHPVEFAHISAGGLGRPGERGAQRRSFAYAVAHEPGSANGRGEQRLAPEGLVDHDLARGDACGTDAVFPALDIAGIVVAAQDEEAARERTTPARSSRAPRPRRRTRKPPPAPTPRSALPSARVRGTGRWFPRRGPPAPAA